MQTRRLADLFEPLNSSLAESAEELGCSSFRVILAHVTWPRAQPLGQSVSLKFLLGTRLESEFFELLIDFLAFLVQNL